MLEVDEEFLLRTISFPQNHSLGTLYLLEKTGGEDGWWENKYAPARGDVDVPANANLHLLVAPHADIYFLRNLAPDALQSIDLRQFETKDSDLEAIKHFNSLRYLIVGDHAISDHALYHLSFLTMLHTLDLSGTQVSDFGLDKLATLSNLRKLYLDGTKVTEAGAAELNSKIPNCQIVVHSKRTLVFSHEESPGRLWLSKVAHANRRTFTNQGDVIGSVEIPRRAFARLEILNKEAFAQSSRLKPDDLQSLDYFFEHLTPEDLEAISKLSGLREIRFAGTRIFAGALEQLQAISNLRSLEFTSCSIGKDALKPLLSMTSLRELRLSHCSFEETDLGEILQKLDIAKLILEGPGVDDDFMATIIAAGADNKVQELYLAFAAVGDHGLAALKYFSNLTTLVLRLDAITDQGLAALHKLKHLKRLVIRCEHLKSKVFQHLAGLTALEELTIRLLESAGSELPDLNRLTGLRKLTLSIQNGATSHGLFIPHLPILEELSLRTTCEEVELADLPRLRVLDLNNCGITDDGLIGLTSLHNLETLHLKGCQQISSKTIAKAGRLYRLKELDISMTRATNASLEALGELKDLRYLNISSTACDNSGLKYLAKLHELRQIEFPRALVDDDLANIENLTRLKHLRLGQITDSGLATINKLILLEKLNLSSSLISNEGLQHTRNFAALKELDLSNTVIDDQAMVYLSNFQKLESLNLGGTLVSDEGLCTIANLVNLHTLDLENVRAVRDRGLAVLRALTGLRHLNLARTRITNEGLKVVGRLTRLESLRLSFTQIDDAGLQGLEILRALKVLHLDSVEITGDGLKHLRNSRRLLELKLSGTPVEDEHMSNLAYFPALTELNLRDTKLSGAALPYIASCANLKTLNLANTLIRFEELVCLSELKNLETLYFHTSLTERSERSKLARTLGRARLIFVQDPPRQNRIQAKAPEN